jgi:two-component system sensor histidine kinase ChvG
VRSQAAPSRVRRALASLGSAVSRVVGRIGVRLMLVNGVVLIVPVVGLEFARIHERQLLEALERDMKNQAALVRVMVEAGLDRGEAIGDSDQAEILTAAARTTRTRIRLLDEHGAVVADSHEYGPPEGPELPPPRILGRSLRGEDRSGPALSELRRDPSDPNLWPEIAERVEVRTALAGAPASYTRLRARDPGVFLFVTDPVRESPGGRVVGAVYAARSTRPVMVELYRIRAGLVRVLCVAFFVTALVTLLLAWSISRPLGKLSRAAKRVAGGERNVVIPVGGGGEIAELGASFAAMKERLDARLRYIEGFAADVAHEFKSPLTSIRGAAELLGEGAADEPEARGRFLRNIELDVARLDRLVSRLLQLSRLEASREAMAPVDVARLLARVTERASLPDRSIHLDDHAPVRTLLGREADLEAALVNLLDNALRFSPAGRTVEVDTSGTPASLVVSVRDHGPGISPANLAKVFDRFFTTDADKDGTGLGLAIVKTVVQAHGGTVRAESTPGEGATFVVTLPVRRA